MELNDIIQALADKGLGSLDFLTGEITVEMAQLNEDINGDGGITVSWTSAAGGVIPAGDTLLGYVMMAPYVPNLNDNGTYNWSPKWSEPSAILGKTPYGKRLTMVRRDSWLDGGNVREKGVVKCVMEDEYDFPTGLVEGDLAIKNQDNCAVLYYWHADEEEWVENGPEAADGDMWRNEEDGTFWAYISDEWVCKGGADGEETELYTHAFAGSVAVAVDDMNTFLTTTLGEGWEVKLHDDGSNGLANTRIVCSFDGSSVKDAIEEIANKAAEAYTGDGAVNLYYVGKTIHIGLSHAFAADDYYNRFVVLGGTRNMAKRVPAGNAYAAITQRMHIPEGNYTIDGETVTVEKGSVIDMRTDKATIAPMTRFLVWDEIYPKLELTIKGVTERRCYLLDENGNKIPAVDNPSESIPNNWKQYSKWYVTLKDSNGDDYTLDRNYIIQDKPLSILFQSGPLTGREFEVLSFYSGNTPNEKESDDIGSGHQTVAGEFRIIIKADGDILLPTGSATYSDGGLCPQVGNVVTLVNVAIEDNYKTIARMELLKKGWAMAKLISSGKQAAWDEKITGADVITGETGDVTTLGESPVGQELSGYVVTGIETNLVTGEKKYSWGTFKPRGILSSSIDKIGSLSLSGGEATFAPLVTSVDDGSGEHIIYVGSGQTDNGSSEGSSTTTSQGASTAIRQAGGNTNIKTVYKKIGENDAFASLVELVWNFLATSGSQGASERPASGSYVQIVISQSGGTVNGHAISSSTPDLYAAFAAVYYQVGEKTIKLYNGIPVSPNVPAEYDVYVTPLKFQTIDGGINAWLYSGGEWKLILTSTTAIIDNLGKSINLAVVGSVDGNIDVGSGLLTTNNMLRLFSEAQYDSKTLAEALLDISTKYHVKEGTEQDPVWEDVYKDYADDKWRYVGSIAHEAGTEYTGKVSNIVAYSFAGMKADLISFQGQNIDFTPPESYTNDKATVSIGFAETTIAEHHGQSITGGTAFLQMTGFTPSGSGYEEKTLISMTVTPQLGSPPLAYFLVDGKIEGSEIIGHYYKTKTPAPTEEEPNKEVEVQGVSGTFKDMDGREIQVLNGIVVYIEP